MNESALVSVLEPVVAAHALELDDLTVVRAGKRSVLRITLDGDGPDGRGPTIDDIAEATRAISAALDESDAVGDAPYTLEVGSRGVSSPLERPAHWRRNLSRLVRITPVDGDRFVGRIRAVDDTGADVDVDGRVRRVGFDEVRRAVVQVEMNPKDEEA
ncbi:Ribosome maturation factor RimP, C-terminal [Propionibacterium ruminifibrarum]|uniref:Ribosome maturation factor RimP n=1 Tax=Propionibacterium ruminifibrarum TaxID=1962131 RepID=A0A375I396_9ACTN|nr:Ribosome maturation factor RimP, C-terminal [Propionibacterium ruminifibrarum]